MTWIYWYEVLSKICIEKAVMRLNIHVGPVINNAERQECWLLTHLINIWSGIVNFLCSHVMGKVNVLSIQCSPEGWVPVVSAGNVIDTCTYTTCIP